MRAPGDVFHYPYLWASDAARLLEHPKNRVTCLAVARSTTDREGVQLHHLLLLGITDQLRPDQEGLDVPAIEKRRAGLVVSRAAYVVVSEYNYDVLPLSWHDDPNSQSFGAFSRGFLDIVQRRFFGLMRARETVRQDRTTS